MPVCAPQVLDYAARWHPDQEIVSKSVEGPITVSTYADLAQRAKLCAVALQRLGIRWGGGTCLCVCWCSDSQCHIKQRPAVLFV